MVMIKFTLIKRRNLDQWFRTFFVIFMHIPGFSKLLKTVVFLILNIFLKKELYKEKFIYVLQIIFLKTSFNHYNEKY